MEFYDVQIVTDMEECVVLQVCASTSEEAEMTAISLVETGEAGTEGRTVINCFTL